jgi:hypothetical protein
MSSDPSRRPSRGPRDTGRIFADDGGRLWNATVTLVNGVDTIVFSCVSEARQPAHALSLGEPLDLAGATEGDLQRLLSSAPRVRPIE